MHNLKPDRFNKSEFCSAAIDHLATDIDQLKRFLLNSGYTPDGLRQSLDTPELQNALLHFFGENEDLLLSLCANRGFSAERVTQWLQAEAAGRDTNDELQTGMGYET